MKDIDKIDLIGVVSDYVKFKDGFWIFNNEVVSEKKIRKFIKYQGIPVLEKDITDILSELAYGETKFDIDSYFTEKIKASCSTRGNKSKYFESLDLMYPGNKFRQIMNYYLFSDDCYCFMFVGYGQTGKTTFVSLIARIIGEEFFGRASVSLLKNSYGTATLEGKKIFEITEAQDLDHNTANMLKDFITNDDIYINPKFQLPRTIKPHLKMIATCNNTPRFKITDDGIIRRFITIDMNKKFTKQTKNFVDVIEDDIPNIISEALSNPFRIEDFALEQYKFFTNDPQYGFGFGIKDYNYTTCQYERYKTNCSTFGYYSRNKINYDKFIELAKIYYARINKCDITLNAVTARSGTPSLMPCDNEDLPF